ncbi:MAG: acyl-CoA thioesterase [Fusobacteriota bacterium]
MHELIHRVYYYETDKMGRVYHANFLNWLEEARTEYIREYGVSYKSIEDKGYYLPIREVNIKYINPVKYDEEVKIITTVEKVTRVKVVFKYEIYNLDKTIKFGKATTVNVLTDTNGKLIKDKLKLNEGNLKINI